MQYHMQYPCSTILQHAHQRAVRPRVLYCHAELEVPVEQAEQRAVQGGAQPSARVAARAAERRDNAGFRVVGWC